MEFINIEPITFGVVGWPQVLLIVIALLLLFGGKKLPELMKGLGKGIKEFKDATKEGEEDKTQEENKEA